MVRPIRRALGISGIARNESRHAKQVAKYFEWLMFLIALGLPFYWYFLAKREIYPIVSTSFLWFIWVAFVAELLTLTIMVRNKRFYLRTNWLNLVIIFFTFPLLTFYLPFLSVFWLARLLVLFRVLMSWWDRQKDILAKNHLSYTLIAFASIAVIGGALVSLFDTGIRDPITGIWWAVQTITTVGYGDIVPKTLFGRAFAVLIMVMGVALITILTANFSAFLLGQKDKEQEEIKEQEHQALLEQVQENNKRLKRIENELKKLNKDK